MTTSSRREFLIAGLGAGLGAATLRTAGAAPAPAPAAAPGGFRYSLNTSTLMGQKLGIVKEVEIAAKAGYQAIEVWIRSIDEYVSKGGSLDDLRKRIADAGLTVEGAIAFAPWIVDDAAQRAKALEQAGREMELLAKIGGKRIAAPPVGANKGPVIELDRIAERYRALLDVGDKTGVVPELELWGSSKNLFTLAQCAYVAIAAGHPKACVLADVYHIYKGGGGFEGLGLLGAQAAQVCHMNDYPANPPREAINDSARVYPGDGIAPWGQIMPLLRKANPNMILSLELFNPVYWKLDALDVAKTGLAKLKKVAGMAAEA